MPCRRRTPAPAFCPPVGVSSKVRFQSCSNSRGFAGLPGWYIDAQLTKFQSGIRGYDPHDETGAKMRKMSLRAANPNDRNDIISFLTTLGAEFPIEKE